MKITQGACTLAAVALVTVGSIALAARDQLFRPAGAPAVIRENRVPGNVESTARRLANQLKQDGYDVSRGYFKLYTKEDCDLSYEVMRTCYGNNPAAPYVLPVVPPWPDEWVDAATAGAFGETADGYSGSYRLHPREALVILGRLPPRADYFGLQTYLFTRPGQWDETSFQYSWLHSNAPYMLETFFGRVPLHPERLQVFANLSNSINHAVIETQSHAVWDQLRYFIITPDDDINSAVRDAFADIGIADQHIFTEPIPHDVRPSTGETIPIRIGPDAESDDFLTVIRYAMPDDGGLAGSGSDTWRKDLPLVVLRIRDTQLPDAVRPYPTLVFDERTGTQPPETALQPDLVALATAVCARWQQCGTDFRDRVRPFLNTQLPPLLTTGPECMKVGMNCLAPTEDTTYFLSGKLPFGQQTVYAIVGALSTMTGNATYVGFGLNSSLKKLGFDNLRDEQLAGSGSEYPQISSHEKLFVQYVARDCSGLETLTGGHCYSVLDLLPYCTDPADLGCDMLVVSVRGYVRPGTRRGVAPALALAPMVIRLNRP
jgi:hypothetical protein